MSFALDIVSVPGRRARISCARLMATNPSLTVQEALTVLEHLPYTVTTVILLKDANAAAKRYQRTGATVTIREIHDEQQHTKEHAAQPSNPIRSSHALKKASFRPRISFAPRKRRPSISRSPRWKPIVICLVVALMAALCLLIQPIQRSIPPIAMFRSGKQQGFPPNTRRVHKPGAAHDTTSETRKETVSSKQSVEVKPPPAGATPSQEQIRLSRLQTDSAGRTTNFLDAASRYRTALSLNQYNVDAWVELTKLLRKNSRDREARRVERLMEKNLGFHPGRVRETTQQFGTDIVIDAGGCGKIRVEYRSFSTSLDGLGREAYKLMRECNQHFSLTSLSVFVALDDGKGLLASCRGTPFPESYDRFQAQASLQYLR